MRSRFALSLLSLVALCAIVALALALQGRVAPETATRRAPPDAEDGSSQALHRELPAAGGEAEEIGSVPRSRPVAPETAALRADKAEDGWAQALHRELSAAVAESPEASSVPRSRPAGSETLHIDALKAGDEAARALYRRFLAKIEAKGSLPLIIGLSSPIAPESSLANPSLVEQQRGRIDAVQDHLLADLAGGLARGVKRFETVPYLALTIGAEGLAELVGSDPVITVQEDVALAPALLDSVPLIEADTLHTSSYNGTGYAVAILDTGVDKTHPFLDGSKVVSEACYSTTNAAAKSTSACPSGVAESTAAGSGAPCDARYAGCNHGTHVAGVAAGKDGTGATGGTLQGTAPDASIIAIQVFSEIDDTTVCPGTPEGRCVLTYTSDQMKGLERVYALRDTYEIAAVTLSLAGDQIESPCDNTHLLTATIDNLRAVGIATVIAAGNSGYDGATGEPGCISTATTVGASNKQDGLWNLSNHAAWVDVIAPGVAIQSSLPGTTYGSYYGTSQAVPHVAGCFALFRHKHPTASVTAIEEALKSAATVSLTRDGISKPRIDCHAAVQAPSATTLVAPMGLITGTTPKYSWNALADATSYDLQVERGGSETHRASYTAAQASCAAGTGTCSVTPDTALQNGAYLWRIQARNTHGVGPWSDRLDFALNSPPVAATPIAPLGETTGAMPTYSWNAVAAAASYNLEVDRGTSSIHKASYTAAQAGCAAGTGTCEVTPGVVLQRGAHRWRVETVNTHGSGPWSSRTDFTVANPPGAATLVSPRGTTNVTTPAYSWNAVAGATSYLLLVHHGSDEVLRTWYTATQAECAASTETCSVTPSTILQTGTHTGYIQTRNSYGRGPWSDSLEFVLSAGLPGAATPVSPQGATTDTTPTYSWGARAYATHYHLWVGNGSGKVVGTWYTTTEAGCAAGTGTCSVTPSAALQIGTHTLYIQTWNSHGRGPWSVRTDFTVGTGFPGAATLVAPRGVTTDTTPAYSWNAVATVTSYYLLVESGPDKIVGSRYTAAQAGCAAGIGTCSVTPSTALGSDAHVWWIKAQNSNGSGPWSARADFAVGSGIPGAATLVSPQGATTDTTPAYSWNAVATATSYYLWVGSGSDRIIGTEHTATQAGCAAGTGVCKVTPSTALEAGAHTWWIQPRNSHGHGPRSARADFTVTDGGGS